MIRDAIWLIGIDDTDIPGTRGTGRLARMTAEQLEKAGMRCLGVTRHQLLVHPDVPYTSHNSSACIVVDHAPQEFEAMFYLVCSYVALHSPKGSDPGVCAARADAVGEWTREFGRRAQSEIVRLSEAEGIGFAEGYLHVGLGGSRDGMIGALAAVGLRAAGNDGRFIELGRIREVKGRAQAKTILRAGVDAVESVDGESVEPEAWIQTFNWVRPCLCGGRAVLRVKRSTDYDTDWVVVGRCKAKKPKF